MYEPKYYPQLTETLHVFSDMRFLVTHTKRYRRFDDSNTDPLHVHNYLEIFLNVSSDVSFLVNNSLYPVGAGDVVVSRPGDIHKGVFHKSQVVENVCLWIDADFHSAPFSFLWKKEFCVLLSFSEEEKQRFQSLIFSLIDACKNNSSELEKASHLLQILTMLAWRP